jgi:hypothetical protein
LIGISLAVSLLILLSVVVASLIRLARRLFFRNRLPLKPQPGTQWLTIGPRLAAFFWIIVTIWLVALSVNLQNEALPSFSVIQRYFSLMNWFSVLAVFFSIFALLAGIRAWRRTDLRVISRVKFSLVAAACVFLTWYSLHWNLIGPVHRF